MPTFRLPKRFNLDVGFPDPTLADPDRPLAVGANLQPDTLLAAYRTGIFPWFSKGSPVLWWSPDPRMVLFPHELHLSHSLQRSLKQAPYEIRLDTAFEQVISRCAGRARPGQDGTWITEEMRESYVTLHRLGWAHSVEAWDGPGLAGGLYGVSIGGVFFGESMFADRPEASKIAFAKLVAQLTIWNFSLIDCQIYTEHLARFGARQLPRSKFLTLLKEGMQLPNRLGPWAFDNPVRSEVK